MSDSDDDLRFRDQCAMQVLQAFISRNQEHDSITGDFINQHDSEESVYREYAHTRMQKLVRASYLIADMMRKARLATFE